ncbi:hypothetical protein BH10PSE7_BH10PSE7_15650 [soil metagenome]
MSDSLLFSSIGRKPLPQANDYEGRIALAMEGSGDISSLPRVQDAGKIIDDGKRRWQTMFNGVQVLADGYYGEWMTRLITALKGHHEPQEERVFYSLVEQLPEAPTMIELGAYWAYYSIWLKKRRPFARAIIVEPDPTRCAVGIANAARNAVAVSVEIAGIQTGGGYLALSAADVQNVALCVPAVSVQELMSRQGLERLTVLHADIQGAEEALLTQARPLLERRSIDYLLVSTHSEQLHSRCLNIFRDVGYRIIAEHTPEESYSFDGLIAVQSTDTPILEVSITKR